MPNPVCGVILVAAATGLALGCGAASTAPTAAFDYTDSFTAAIDTASFSAPPSGISALASSAVPGGVTISATSGSGPTFDTIVLRLGYLNGPGTYPLGVNQATTPGGIVQLLTSINAVVSTFSTPLSGVAGSVNVTNISGTAITGTFSAGTPPTSPATGAPHVVVGSFNVPISGGFVPATAANPGDSVMTALNGTPYIAGTVTASVTGGGFTLTATTTSPTGAVTTITFAFPETSAGTYPFYSATGPAVAVTVVENGTTYGGGIAGDAGSVTITSESTAGVVQGTFSGTLTGGLGMANGQFTVKLPPG